MTVQELKEELQKLEDQGHGDKIVKYFSVYKELEEIDITYIDLNEVVVVK